MLTNPYKGAQTLLKVVNLKVDAVTLLEFELVYFEAAV